LTKNIQIKPANEKVIQKYSQIKMFLAISTICTAAQLTIESQFVQQRSRSAIVCQYIIIYIPTWTHQATMGTTVNDNKDEDNEYNDDENYD